MRFSGAGDTLYHHGEIKVRVCRYKFNSCTHAVGWQGFSLVITQPNISQRSGEMIGLHHLKLGLSPCFSSAGWRLSCCSGWPCASVGHGLWTRATSRPVTRVPSASKCKMEKKTPIYFTSRSHFIHIFRFIFLKIR